MRRLLGIFTIGLLGIVSCAAPVLAQTGDSAISLAADESVTEVVFSDQGIEVSGQYAAEEGLAEENTLTITGAGSYILSGSCSDGHVLVAKDAGEVQLILNGLELTAETVSSVNSAANSAIVTKGGSNDVTIMLAKDTKNSIRSNVDDSTAINASKDLTISGSGELTVTATKKNGIKSDKDIVIKDGVQLSVTAAKNGISADDKLTIKGGEITVTAEEGDALRSNPDVEDIELTEDGSAVAGKDGLVEIQGGTLTLSAGDDGIQGDYSVSISGGDMDITAGGDGIVSNNELTLTDSNGDSTTVKTGDISITGGTYQIESAGDGIQSGQDLTISAGSYNIKTNGGYTTSLSADADSCKAIKASDTITISGGYFTINSADDAIHSNQYIYLDGGHFDIDTGDDGAHADTSLYVGQEGAEDSALYINILSSYEGLEAGTVYMYSGEISVIASDDGINAAGDSSQGEDSFNPWGGGNRPGQPGQQTGSTESYAIDIYGGEIYVNADGDGLDANGTITISGGNVTVYGQEAGGDNNPLDSDNGCKISAGATVFAAGSSAMDTSAPQVSGQGYYLSGSSSSGDMGRPGMQGGTGSVSVAAGSVISILSGENILASYPAIKNINYIFYTSPAMSVNTSYTMSTTAVSETRVSAINVSPSSVDLTVGEKKTVAVSITPADATNQKLAYSVADPSIVQISSDGEITALAAGTTQVIITACDGSGVSVSLPVNVKEAEEETKTFYATFATDEHTKIALYYSQDYSTPDETDVTTAIARDGDSGEIDSSGSGQVNFAVLADDGYEIESVSVAPAANYKNLKDSEDTGVSAIYRVTKIKGDIVITVSSKKTESTDPGQGEGSTEGSGGNTDQGEGSTEESGGNTDQGEDSTEGSDGSTEQTADSSEKNENQTQTTTASSEPSTKSQQVTAADKVKNAFTMNATLKVSQTKKQINVSWGKVSGASGYEVYAAYCSRSFGKAVKTVASTTNCVKITKISGKKINLKKNFKVYVLAYKLVNGKKVTLGKTITAHVVGKKNSTYTNVKQIKLSKTSYSLKKGKKIKIKARTVLVQKSKKQLSNQHARQFRYASTNKAVATVDSKGNIKAVGRGSCLIYVYARNGYARKIKIKVTE